MLRGSRHPHAVRAGAAGPAESVREPYDEQGAAVNDGHRRPVSVHRRSRQPAVHAGAGVGLAPTQPAVRLQAREQDGGEGGDDAPQSHQRDGRLHLLLARRSRGRAARGRGRQRTDAHRGGSAETDGDIAADDRTGDDGLRCDAESGALVRPSFTDGKIPMGFELFFST